MMQAIPERRDTFAVTMRGANAHRWRHLAGAAITGGGAAVLLAQAAHLLAGG